MTSQADIERELRSLNNTLGSASPFSAAGSATQARRDPMITIARQPVKRRGRTLPEPNPKYLTARSTMSRGGSVAGDGSVRDLVGGIAAAEGTARTADSPKKEAMHVVDHVKKLNSLNVETAKPRSMASEAFEFSDEMKEELSERSAEFCFKRDEFRDYVEASAKYKHLSDSKF